MNTVIALIVLLFFACYLTLYLWLEVRDKEAKISELFASLKEAEEQADRYYPATEHLVSAEHKLESYRKYSRESILSWAGVQENAPEKGGKVLCLGVGYPHLRGEIVTVDEVFENGDLLIRNAVRVNSEDFVGIKD